RVRFAVQVEAGHLGQLHPRIEPLGIGLAREHLDLMPEFDQATAEMPDIDALPAAVGLASIRQQRDAHISSSRSAPTAAGCVRSGSEPANRESCALRALWTCVQTIV